MNSNERSQEMAQLLDDLDTDRSHLADRIRVPGWLAPGFGVLAGAYVAIPAIASARIRDIVFFGAIALAVALVYVGYRKAGIKPSGFGPVGVGYLLGAAVAVTVGRIVALGLDASELTVWVWVAAVAAAVAVTVCVRGLVSAARDRLRSDR